MSMNHIDTITMVSARLLSSFSNCRIHHILVVRLKHRHTLQQILSFVKLGRTKAILRLNLYKIS
jgi:hypothetical protein